MGILEGSVLFVDDDLRSEEQTQARAFYEELRSKGRPVAAYEDVPELAHLLHWDGLALAVLDWDLNRSERRELGVSVPEELVKAKRTQLIEFLIDLLDKHVCPVFIVSQREPEKIESDLRAAPGFPNEAIGRRVRILPKEEGDLLPKLEEIVTTDSVLAILRVWEQQYQRAKNRMFNDFGSLTADWPAHIVRAAQDDGVDESFELVETLFANLRHRVDLVSFDIDSIDLSTVDVSASAARRVVHGRRVLAANRLHRSTIMPGDYFSGLFDDDPAGSIWLNLTPACYTVTKRGSKVIDPRLHLIRGVPVAVPTDSTSKESKEFERVRQASRRSVIVDFLTPESAFKFTFDTLDRRLWSEISEKRAGRLLSPYITDVQLRHATYMTSEGLPRIRPEMYRLDDPGPTQM